MNDINVSDIYLSQRSCGEEAVSKVHVSDKSTVLVQQTLPGRFRPVAFRNAEIVGEKQKFGKGTTIFFT